MFQKLFYMYQKKESRVARDSFLIYVKLLT